MSVPKVWTTCSWHEGSGPAGLPRSIEEVWRKSWIVIFIWYTYVCPLYMRCSMSMLFTCVLVLSRQIVRGGCKCEKWIVGTNSKILGGPRQTGRYMWKRAGKRFSLTQRRGHDGRICEVLQESSRSRMYKVYHNINCVKRKENWNVVSRLHHIHSCLIIYS